MEEDNRITEVEFTFRCAREWESLNPTENPDVRFCDQCNLNVHFVGVKSDFAKYDSNAKCFAVKIFNEDKTRALTFAGGISLKSSEKYPPRESFTFKFGAKSELSESQLNTIKWLRNLGGAPVLKDKMVRLLFGRITKDEFDRIVSILEKEAIPFIVE